MEHIGKIIRPYLKDLGIDRAIKKYEAISMWSKVVGKRIAKETEPTKISGNKLFIKVNNDAWRNELVFHKEEIIKKINKKLGSVIIKEIILL